MSAKTATIIREAAIAGARAAAASPTIDIGSSAVGAVAERVTREVVPIVDHMTNNEPWYKSRVTWGAIVSIATGLLGAFGVATDWIDPDQAIALGMALGSTVGGAIALYGRWKARKPIGA